MPIIAFSNITFYDNLKNEYENSNIRELTDEEKEKVNKRLIDIIEID